MAITWASRDERATEPPLDADVIIVGGGPAGAALGTLLARDGYRTIILEKEIHPRDHVGERVADP